MIQISSLLFRNYRAFVSKYKSKLIIKFIIFLEIIEWILIVLLLNFAVKIASFL
jgi:hypothetical protein